MLFFSSLTSPSCPSLLRYERCSRPLIMPLALDWTSSTNLVPCIKKPSTGLGTLYVFHQGLAEEEDHDLAPAPPDAAQHSCWTPFCKTALLAYGQLTIQLAVLFCKLLSSSFSRLISPSSLSVSSYHRSSSPLIIFSLFWTSKFMSPSH